MLINAINQYVELHQAMGFKYRIQNCLLQNFALFAQAQGDSYVRSKTVIEWAAQAPSTAQKRNRLLTIRRFAKSMQSEDRRYEIPPADVFGRNNYQRRIPRILTQIELKQLLKAAAKLKPVNTIRPLTYATLFSLLAATGLRISEVLRLNLEDITDDGLIVRATKFRKDRWVPLHESTKQGIEHYLSYRIQYGGTNCALFVSNNMSRLSYSTVNTIFLQLTRSIGLRDDSGHSGICIHDLRHRFAVISLEQCPSDRISVLEHMTALSTYLGHAHISDTYWYLEATPILMKKIAVVQETLYRSNIK